MPYRPLALLALSAAVAAGQDPKDADRFARWEKEVAGIETRLKDGPLPANPVVFAGSSSVRLWKLDRSFPGKPAVNVGFGGSQVRDCTHFAPRLIGPHRPSAVVFYGGDNDIAAGRTPEQVRDDFRAFAAAVWADAPKAKVWFLAVKPSVARWKLFDTQTAANKLVKEVCGTDPRLGYLDVATPMLGPDGGKPADDLFVKDGLHLSEKGYAVWAKVVAEALGW